MAARSNQRFRYSLNNRCTIAVASALVASFVHAAGNPEATTQTVGGTLKVAGEWNAGQSLTLNGKSIPGVESDFLTLKQTLRVAGNDVVLVMKGNAGSCCNTYSTLIFVSVAPSGRATVSDGMDSGEDGLADVKANGDQLAVTTETADGRRKKTHRYTYVNGRVSAAK